MEQSSSENVVGADNQQERSAEMRAMLQEAQNLLGGAYNEELVSKILQEKPFALEDLRGVRTSTNSAMRRRYLNGWYKDYKEELGL